MGGPEDGAKAPKLSAAANQDFPQYPGPDSLAHAGAQYLEDIDARFALLGLKGVAQGHDSPGVRAIIDTDLSMVPVPPATHKDYYRIMEFRTKIQNQNAVNEQKRLATRMGDWTSLYGWLKLSTEKTAPILSRDLTELCDMQTIHGDATYAGYFDGPLAYKIVKNPTHPSTSTAASIH